MSGRVFETPTEGRTFAEGAALGCPDCEMEEDHCCPFAWADDQLEPTREWVLQHMRDYFEDVGITPREEK